jgi:hypothetical protein
VLDQTSDAPAAGGADDVVRVEAPQQEERLVVELVEMMPARTCTRCKGPVAIAVWEVDDVIGAEVLGRRVAADGVADDGDELAAREVRRRQAVVRLVDRRANDRDVI